MSRSGGPNIINEGLVFLLDANNVKSYTGSGVNCFNISNKDKTNNLLELINGTTHVISDISYFEFDGVDDSIRSTSTSYFWEKIPKNFTINTWCSHDRNYELTHGAIVYFPGLTIQRIYLVVNGNSISLRVVDEDKVLSGSISTSDFILADYPNEFNYISVTCEVISEIDEKSLLKIFINGVEVNEVEIDMVVNRENSVLGEPRIGEGGISGSNRYKGKISYISIYDRTLNADEIKRNYLSHRSKFF